jgi:hypothetical protein
MGEEERQEDWGENFKRVTSSKANNSDQSEQPLV